MWAQSLGALLRLEGENARVSQSKNRKGIRYEIWQIADDVDWLRADELWLRRPRADNPRHGARPLPGRERHALGNFRKPGRLSNGYLHYEPRYFHSDKLLLAPGLRYQHAWTLGMHQQTRLHRAYQHLPADPLHERVLNTHRCHRA